MLLEYYLLLLVKMQPTKFSVISSDHLKFFLFFFTITKTSFEAIFLERFNSEQHALLC